MKIKIRPLIWNNKEGEADCFYSKTITNTLYEIFLIPDQETWATCLRESGLISIKDSLEEAKQSAQLDWETRINSLLDYENNNDKTSN